LLSFVIVCCNRALLLLLLLYCTALFTSLPIVIECCSIVIVHCILYGLFIVPIVGFYSIIYIVIYGSSFVVIIVCFVFMVCSVFFLFHCNLIQKHCAIVLLLCWRPAAPALPPPAPPVAAAACRRGPPRSTLNVD
jgi:hypothetical protein